MSNQKEVDKIVDALRKKEDNAKDIHDKQTSQSKIDELINQIKKKK